MNFENVKVMLIEDDLSIRKFTSINLKREHFEVLEASSAEEALLKLKTNLPEIIILDIMLPGMDGFELCSKIKDLYPDISIIILTSRNQDMDKIMGLELGADDYIVKPFNPLELTARIRAVLRRTNKNKNTSQILLSGNISINLKAQRASKDSMELELSPKEFELLKIFIENSGTTLTRDELLDFAWGRDFFGDVKTVDVHVRRLREKIEDDPSNPMHIETIWGIGYRWREA
jgi:DNA-binding response OmpR family regulator